MSQYSCIWIGATNVDGSWTWLDGTPWADNTLSSSEINDAEENYLAISSEGRWKDYAQTQEMEYVCKMPEVIPPEAVTPAPSLYSKKHC